MVRDGANLSAADKTKLVAMNSKLEGLFSAFSSKLLGDEKLYSFVTDKAELAGLEPGFVASLAAAAEANGKPGQWAIKNTRSSAQPVLQNATNRALREKVYKAFVSRGDNGDANDTTATDRKSTSLNTSHYCASRLPSSALKKNKKKYTSR